MPWIIVGVSNIYTGFHLRLFAVVLLFLGINGQLQAAIDAAYEGSNGVRSKVLTVCMQCHSSSVTGAARNQAPVIVNFDTYADAALWGDMAVTKAAIEESMPPSSVPRLTQEQKSALFAWQAAGFPEKSASAQDTQAPATPSGLAATTIGSSEIDLAWTASTDNVAMTGYRIYRAGVQIGTSATTISPPRRTAIPSATAAAAWATWPA